MTEQPLTQAQDHDRRTGRLEGIAELLIEQGRLTNARLDRIEQALAEQGRELRAEARANFRWIMTTLIGIFLAVMSIAITILIKIW